MLRSLKLSALAATALLLGATVPVAAQNPATQSPAARTPAPLAPQANMNVQEAELQQFAQAVGEIRQLRRKWMPQVEAAAQSQGPDAALKVQDEAYTEMVGAVEKKGLSLKRYNEIASLAENDPELQQRLAAHIPPTTPAQ
jgi:hypothetical protein